MRCSYFAIFGDDLDDAQAAQTKSAETSALASSEILSEFAAIAFLDTARLVHRDLNQLSTPVMNDAQQCVAVPRRLERTSTSYQPT